MTREGVEEKNSTKIIETIGKYYHEKVKITVF